VNAPLENIRVLDLSRVLAGPWASQLLGDFGADVIKIERPGTGDDTRQWGPPWLGGEGGEGGESAYFLSTNRNKRSVTVDITRPEGQQLLRGLAAKSDVVLENFRTGTLERYGVGPKALLTDNPRLVVCSISAFGRTGSRAGDVGYDAMIQASAGLMSITGPPESDGGGPQKVGVAIADIMAGMYAATAILAALQSRQLTGTGQHIDVPLYDSQVAWLANQNLNFLVGGAVPGRMGTAHPNLVPYETFETADGPIMLAVGNDRQFRAAVACLELDQLGDDERFRHNRNRVRNREKLVPLLSSAFRKRPASDWLAALKAAGVPAGPVSNMGEVLTNDLAVERNLVRQLINGQGKEVPTVSNPVAFDATPVTYQRPPPLLGEHTDEVLREVLGYSAEQIDALRKSAVV